jgi:hypothetical protein
LPLNNGINVKTVRKWKNRKTVNDEKMGPENLKSTVLTSEE